MAKKVKICADSTCDLSPELLSQYDIDVFALPVNLGEKACLDGIDVQPDDLYQSDRTTGKLSTTSAPSMPEYLEFFKKYVEQGVAVIHFSISSEMTITHNNCRMAAETLPDVYAIDTQSLSSGMGRLAIEAAKMAQEGMDAESIVERINQKKNLVEVSFILDTLEFLWKGGRCSGLSAMGANLLKLKPCIEVKDGKMVVGKKYRGQLGNVHGEYIENCLKGRTDLDLSLIFITHSGIEQQYIDRAVAKVKQVQPFQEVIVTKAGCSVSSHCGPGTLGIIYMRK